MILGLINRGFSAKPAFTQKPSNAYTVRIKGAKALLPVFLYRCFCKSPFSENEKPFCRNSFTKLCKPFAHWQPQPDWFYLLTITGAEALTATICTLAASTGNTTYKKDRFLHSSTNTTITRPIKRTGVFLIALFYCFNISLKNLHDL